MKIRTPKNRLNNMDISIRNNYEHIHIPIPEIRKGNIENNIAQVPGSNNCIVCGENIPDTIEVQTEYDIFLKKEESFCQEQKCVQP